MELETKEKALEDLRVVVEGGFKGVEKIFAIKGEVVKETGDISNVRYDEYDLDKASCRMNARGLIELLIDKTELAKVRDDREEDGSINYTFISEGASKRLAVALMLVWKDRR